MDEPARQSQSPKHKIFQHVHTAWDIYLTNLELQKDAGWHCSNSCTILWERKFWHQSNVGVFYATVLVLTSAGGRSGSGSAAVYVDDIAETQRVTSVNLTRRQTDQSCSTLQRTITLSSAEHCQHSASVSSYIIIIIIIIIIINSSICCCCINSSLSSPSSPGNCIRIPVSIHTPPFNGYFPALPPGVYPR